MLGILVQRTEISHKPRIIYGTMRMLQTRDVAEWEVFFQQLYEFGVRTIHCSNEYESYPLLCEVMHQLRLSSPAKKFDYMVKVAVPHFDEITFDRGVLRQRLQTYRTDLGCDKVADVQWMWRDNKIEDYQRVKKFEETIGQIGVEVTSLKNEGLIDRFMCFPYSINFANIAIEKKSIDGLVVYRNTFEKEYDAVLDRSAELRKASIVIRPFFAGKAILDSDKSAPELFEVAINHPSVEAAILSTNSIEHLKELRMMI